ncbi:MAG TPA: dephospho-CoA kinase [Terracidiphilus sp.]|nr:dephospho-CoA kinase [Terracidiphilus sp.]
MLRVGLTGSLGSGKSTVAAILREYGAHIIEADALGRDLMEPGQPIYAEILRAFGPEVLAPDGRLDRARLAQLAFAGGRLQQLNAIIHPAVIDLQRRKMDEIFARDPSAVAVVETALIFEVVRDARARGENETVLSGAPGDGPWSPGWLSDWRRRIDRVIVVTAPEDLKIARYAARIAPSGPAREAAEADARLRLSHQISDAEKAAQADYVLDNSGDLASLRAQVDALWPRLQAESNKIPPRMSLQ